MIGFNGLVPYILLYLSYSGVMQTHERQSSLSPAQVAKRLGVSRQTVYALLDKGELVGFRVGTARRVRPIDLETYIEEQIHHG